MQTIHLQHTDNYYKNLFYHTAADYASRMADYYCTTSIKVFVVNVADQLEYLPEIKTVAIVYGIAISKLPYNIFAACHEVAHAIDHQRWPWLFSLRKRTRHIVLGYLINLFLEWHASKLALRYLRNTGNFSARQIDEMETLARKAFKTYL